MPHHAEQLGRALASLRETAGFRRGEDAVLEARKRAESDGRFEALAKLSREQLSRWENGAPLRTRNLFALLDLYGATLADLGDATRSPAAGAPPGRSRYHFIAEQTGREQDLRIAELEAKVRRLQLDVDDLVGTRGEGGT